MSKVEVEKCWICGRKFEGGADHGPCIPFLEELAARWDAAPPDFASDEILFDLYEDSDSVDGAQLKRWSKSTKRKTLGTALYIDLLDD